MKNCKEVNQAIKVTFVFVLITSIFSFLGKLCSFIPIKGNKVNINRLLLLNALWFVLVIITIISMYLWIKKADGEFNLTFIKNKEIRYVAGLLIIFEGLVNISSRISILIMNIQTMQHVSSYAESSDYFIRNLVTSSLIPILINLLQVLLGVYLIRYIEKDTLH